MGRSRLVPIGRFSAIALLLWLVIPVARVSGQYQPPSDFLSISGSRASTWTAGSTNVIQLQGPVTIQTDRAKMSADRAVIWLTPLPGTVLDQERAEIALIGNVSLEQQQPQISRSGDALFVTTEVRGTVRLVNTPRSAEDLSETDLFRDASTMRPIQNAIGARGEITQRPWIQAPTTPPPSTAPTTQERVLTQEIPFTFGRLDTFNTPEGKLAALLTGGITLFKTQANGDSIQLQADRGVLFTPLESLKDATNSDKLQALKQHVNAVYLEGDVRIVSTPADKRKGEQRMRTQRVYYNLETDQAVLTDAVIHSVDPETNIPVVMRAQLVRQLSEGEYKSEGVQLSMSSFATPSYGIYSDRAYVRVHDTGQRELGQQIDFSSRNNLFKLYGLPVFYWPWAGGTVTERGFPLRSVLFGSGSGFGPGIRTEWGLFESLGKAPPEDLDISYKLDYFADRGPAGGIDAKYKGGFVTETTKQPWNFEGDFTSYIVSDHGNDRLGRDRAHVEPEDSFRYNFLWQHQHFFPENWQLQLRAGTASDPTFLEEWFRRDFNDGEPHDVSAYLKHQKETEAVTFGVVVNSNDFVTTADQLQEQFQVERVPEIGYYRVGDSIFSDNLTFFSANTVSGLHFDTSNATYTELGFRNQYDPFPTDLPAGFPSQGFTGTTTDTIYRGDFRQEIDYPINAGQFKVMPYVMGRYTGYTDTPEKGAEGRVFVGSGVRVNTSFWKVDDSAVSDLFDIHRIRHVVEPELHLFTSASTVDRSELFIYDEQVDAINDVSAAQLALRQRWQTKRGGAGQWRSVDLFTLNLEANFFANAPDEGDLPTREFRGLFFPSLPEASIPRNSLNADALWRVSDTTAILSDAQYNLDEQDLATTSIGAAVQRDTRLSYFLGLRYINVVDSVIASFSSNYQLSSKYSVQFSQSLSLNDRKSQNTNVTLTRKFDRYFLQFSFYYDAIDDETGFRFGLFPEGLGYGISSDQLQGALNNQ